MLTDLRTHPGDPDVVVVDPPRAGLRRKALKRLGDRQPKIVYVSCNPTTLADDAKRLADDCASVRARPVDMFPHTPHVKCVATIPHADVPV